MTDSGIYYDEYGNESKKFSTKDAAGFFAAHYIGIKIMVLTGRECAATKRRMEELKVDYLFQNVKNKYLFLNDFCLKNGIISNELGYIGDDLNDLSSMKLAGFKGCPADSCQEIINIADYVSTVKGGYGAVRDIIEYVIKSMGKWENVVSAIYDAGI